METKQLLVYCSTVVILLLILTPDLVESKSTKTATKKEGHRRRHAGSKQQESSDQSISYQRSRVSSSSSSSSRTATTTSRRRKVSGRRRDRKKYRGGTSTSPPVVRRPYFTEKPSIDGDASSTHFTWNGRSPSDLTPYFNKTMLPDGSRVTSFRNVTYYPGGYKVTTHRNVTRTVVDRYGSFEDLYDGEFEEYDETYREDIETDLHPLEQAARREEGVRLYERPHPCEHSSCYPATGNLLIGREDSLYASSTCGLRGKERYCIVSHLEEKKKCFWCDSSPQYANRPSLSHNINNIIDRYHRLSRRRSWWQSANGEEEVFIQLDLEAEFHFTHLIITFKTFRPAAMVIERSYDFGRTWHVYRYFAYDCDESFPGIPKGPLRRITDVICESRYSNVAPSTEGEVIFRVLPPNIRIDDPYSNEVQNLLKMTNLRINFTKLHTLGDDLLDNRIEIKEKYYYAIYDMIVRGSCSCYGHASRCLPLPGVGGRPDMVHGRCECTHNTTGLNCEKCEDFYNDLPWRPAVGRLSNACKRCNCNNHAVSCHFDAAVFESTGRISGGVCDNCEHNTVGRNCEQCKQFFYHDEAKSISHPDACLPCDCDPRGSLDDGVCDAHSDPASGLLSGNCHCKTNVGGRRCDRCRNGFWNYDVNDPDGCRPCSCDIMGTIGNQGCNEYNGECTCKRYVTGRDCNQCLPQYYGLSEDPNGCKPCDCDPGGSYNNDCDVISGQCRCRPHVIGRTCNEPEQGYFAGLMDHLVYEAELARGSEICEQGQDCQVVVREPNRDGTPSTWTGLGFMRAKENSYLEFVVDDIITTMEYDVVLRYEPQLSGQWDDVRVFIQRPDDQTQGVCPNSQPHHDEKTVVLPPGTRYALAQPPACLEAGKTYIVRVEFKKYDARTETPTASILLDSLVLVPRIEDISFFSGSSAAELRRSEFEHFRCRELFYQQQFRQLPEICQKYLYSIGFYTFDGGSQTACDCDPTGSLSTLCDKLGGQCQCKPNVVGRRCDRCAPGTYGFGPEGCRACDCNPVGSRDNFCDSNTGQCKCHHNTYGRECDQCQPGFWSFPNCQQCVCNGHADTCDSRTGMCQECRDFTDGRNCERCLDGFYGDPRLDVGIPCRPCPCPSTKESGHSYADRCFLDQETKDVVCECQLGYAGPRCDVCADNYYGRPEVRGGSCNSCNCSNNIDISRPGNCNPKTGECLQCLFETEGFYCERCREGFYGNALSQLCQRCVCNILGTNKTSGSCDHTTGQCPCLPNVEGMACDVCVENHWKIASGEGCESCACDLTGSYSPQCNLYDGQCQCKPGFGGRKCDQCETNFYGNPKTRCDPCDCRPDGSITLQCDHTNGSCVCREGIGGHKCDECARGYTGDAPYCQPCGECFDNWDRILNKLLIRTNKLIDDASAIKKEGATGAYTTEFEGMENKLNEIRQILSNASINNQDLEDVEKLAEKLQKEIDDANTALNEIEENLDRSFQNITLDNLALTGLKDKANGLKDQAEELKNNATLLQEANVEGALNITREAQRRSRAAQDKVEFTEKDVSDSEKMRERTEIRLEHGAALFNKSLQTNEMDMNDIREKLEEVEAQIPNINKQVCDGSGVPCDSLCGGAGCGKCGGLSCDEGAVSKAIDALKWAKDAEDILANKTKKADDKLKGITQAKKESDNALRTANEALYAASMTRNETGYLRDNITELLRESEEFSDPDMAKPADVRTHAEEVLNKSISLQPQQITELAEEINNTINSLTDIESIIAETAADLNRANALKDRADIAKEHAEQTFGTTQDVLGALEEAAEAQEKAEQAIEEATDNINDAESDLIQITSETADAQSKANESMILVQQLEEDMKAVRSAFAKNDRSVKQAEEEAKKANALSSNADEQADTLEEQYSQASGKLTELDGEISEKKERAVRLRQRANELMLEVESKHQALVDIEIEYQKHDGMLSDLSDEIMALNERMKEYLEDISTQAAEYRRCQT